MSALAAPSPADLLLVLVTVPDEETGARLGRTLVEERLAACVNILRGLRSIYSWQGVVHDDNEALCLVKTDRRRFEALRARVEALHPYEVPEIIGVSMTEANGPYLAWVLAGAAPA